MTTITRLSDNEGKQRPVLARVYVVRNEDEERKKQKREARNETRRPQAIETAYRNDS